ncbi:MAG TPA: ABC transporter permease [Vicinamibacterales bacterium]|nr:ABC transporter permease [Vicinamibacterales bacterium]
MLRDLKFALHLIVKDRWYSAVAIIALALGIGVNATVFTLVNAVLLRGLPYKDSDKLYMLSAQPRQGGRSLISPMELDDWREQARSFTALAAFTVSGANVADDRAAPQSVRSTRLSANAFSLLGQQPLFGRDFAPGDDAPGAERVVLLGYALWKNRYGDDRSVIGKSLRIDGKPATIVGVMPDGMMFPSNAEMWVPLVRAPEDKRSSRYVQVFGRLRDGVTKAQAQTELNGIAARLAAAYPDTNKEHPKANVETFNERFNGGPIRTVMLAMMGAVSFVLLIACANVANLLLSRSVHRSREIAVRIALGATRWRVVRQLLIESICLGVMGGAIGLGLAVIGVRLFDRAVEGSGKPYWVIFTFDATVFAFLAAICVLTGIIFGLAPALQVTKTNVNDVLKEGGRGNAGGMRARWLTGTMVVLELALTLVLLVGAGLMIRSFMKLYTLDLGIKTDNLLTIGLGLSNTKYPNAEARRTFYDSFAPRLATIPGVQSVAFTTSVPPFGSGTRQYELEGEPVRGAEQEAPRVSTVVVSPGFFDTVGVQLRRGRVFHDNDGNAGAETVIINERFAAEVFKNEDPIGRRLRFVQTPPPGQAADKPQPPAVWRTVVGISPTIRHANSQDAQPTNVVYIPARQEPPGFSNILVRTALPPGSVMSAVREQMRSVDPDQPVQNVQTMGQMLDRQMWPYRVFGSLFAIFAAIALVMSAVGLYAVMAYSVTQRRTEIGVRMALGANDSNVRWLILRRGLWQMGLGLAIGLAGAFGLSRVLRTLLVQVTPTDPLTFVVITVLLTGVAMAACLIPARRASRVDPLVALRAE